MGRDSIDIFSDGDKEETQSNLPEELRGKSPEEIYATLASEHEKEVNAVKGQFSEQLSSLNEKLESISAPKQSQRPPQYVPPQFQQQQEEPDLYTDQEGFMEHQFNKRLGPFVQTMAQNSRHFGRQLFQQKNAEGYDKYKDEIEQFVDGLSPQVQANPQAYDMAYKFIIGTHADDIIKEKTNSAATEKAVQLVSMALEKLGVDADNIDINSIFNGGEEEETKSTSSLFQRQTGTKTKASPNIPKAETGVGQAPSYKGSDGKKKLSAEDKKMMQIFEFDDPDEYLRYKEMNNDQLSALGLT